MSDRPVTAEDWAELDRVQEELARRGAARDQLLAVRGRMWADFMARGVQRKDIAEHVGITGRAVTLGIARAERAGERAAASGVDVSG